MTDDTRAPIYADELSELDIILSGVAIALDQAMDVDRPIMAAGLTATAKGAVFHVCERLRELEARAAKRPVDHEIVT